ncbi:MAG: dTMP kinase [Treponema sp.]|jgi:dTMP kinase|nr:dTMP kinase [Treponema sp.]
MEILRNFAIFEGLDGSGTSTQLRLLEQKLAGRTLNGPGVMVTFEPTDGTIGKLIRSVLKKDLALRADTLARLFAADRGEHLYAPGGIIERCERGELVICDRYTPSSLVYQGIECGMELPRNLNEAFPAPEMLLFFDIDPRLAQQRMAGRPALEIFEHIEFQEKVRKQYHALFDEYRQAGVLLELIDASQSVEKVAEDVWNAITKMPIIKSGI